MTLIPKILIEKDELENKDFQVVSWYSNWKKIEETQLENNDINLYFWMIYKKNNQFYSEEFIISAIKNALENTNWKVNIELWWELSKIMNSEIQQWVKLYDIEEQKKIVLDIINKNFNKIEQKRINLDVINNRHKELFEQLKKDSWFKIDDGNLEDIKNKEIWNITSFDIYKILFLESQKNNNLFKLSADTKTTYIKEKRNERTSYYALAEVAIRLKDLIDWKIIQWWENRQKRYDVIINKILNKEYKFEKLEILYDILEKKDIISFSEENKKYINNFKQFYVNKKQLEEQEENQEELKKINKKIRNLVLKTMLWVSLIIWWPIAWYKYFEYQTEQEIQTRLDKINQNNNNFSKFERDIFKYFIWKYWLWKFEEKELQAVLKDGINIYKIKQKINDKEIWNENFLDSFKKIVFYLKNTLTLNWINLVSPLWQFEDFSKEINNTLKIKDFSNIEFLWRQTIFDKSDFFSPDLWELEVWILVCGKTWVWPSAGISYCRWLKDWRYFVARKKWTEDKFSLELAQKVIQELQK